MKNKIGSVHMKRAFTKVAMTTVALALFAPSAWAAPYEPNDSKLQAFGPLTGGTPYAGAFETENDVDWFYVYSSGQRQVDIATTPGSGCGVTTTLYDADGSELTSSWADADETAHMNYTLPFAARYHLMLSGCTAGNYQVRLDPADAFTLTPPPPPAPPLGPADENPLCTTALVRRNRAVRRVRSARRALRRAEGRGERRYWRRQLQRRKRTLRRARTRVARVC